MIGLIILVWFILSTIYLFSKVDYIENLYVNKEYKDLSLVIISCLPAIIFFIIVFGIKHHTE